MRTEHEMYIYLDNCRGDLLSALVKLQDLCEYTEDKEMFDELTRRVLRRAEMTAYSGYEVLEKWLKEAEDDK